ncbi:MAG: hypothetical protein OHK0046_16870 [Anaerolineae bacterium]
MRTQAAQTAENRQPLYRAGFVLGFGLGGFFDGIILHQILQWHHFVSSIYPVDTVNGLEINTLWDGLFHMTMYIVTAVGLILLWRAVVRRDVPHAPRAVIGALLIGFGVFHLVDSILNHWLLEVHHICYEPNTAVCDGGYFLIGLVLIGLGIWLVNQGRRTRIQ